MHAGGKALTRYQFSSVLEKSLNARGLHGSLRLTLLELGQPQQPLKLAVLLML